MTHIKPAAFFAALIVLLASPAASLRAAPDDTLGMALLSATVDELTPAHIVRGSGAVSVDHYATGAFVVTFDRDLSNCSCVANAGSYNQAVTFGDVFADTHCPSGGSNAVRVFLQNHQGGVTDAPFHVIVFCPK